MIYIPDRWVVVELRSKTETIQKVLSSWYGGYLGSDSWRLSSGITQIIEKEDHYQIHNESGSVYECYKEAYGMSAYTSGIYQTWVNQQSEEVTIRILEEM